MRLAGAEKIGYYPTPDITLQQVSNLLTVNNSSTIRLLDPCAGAGEALAFVQNHLHTTTAATITSYGVEIAHNRIPLAEAALDHVLHADWQDTAISHEAFSLLWLNPPYDTTIEEGKQRQEYLFLKGLYTRLQVGGVLVYIIPIGLLRQEAVCKLLAAYFHSISVRRLCDEEFSLFKQLVIVGVRKPRADPDPHMADYLHQFSMDNLPEVMEPNAPARYTIPPLDIPNNKLIFRKIMLTYEDVLRQAPTQGAYHNRQLQDWLAQGEEAAFRPVVPLKTGHVGSLISSGQMGVINLQTVAAKGRATKVIEYFNAQGETVPSDDASMVESRERFTTEVTTIDQAGNHKVINSLADMETFLTDYAGPIATAISARYQPLYTEATPAEWQHLSTLMRQKKLPGRKVGGLLPAQKHAAAACVRSLKHQGWVDLIGEMGTGKTCTSLAAVDLANAYPAIIMCPGHMVEKWAREAREVVPDVTATIINSLADLNQFVAQARTGGKHVAVLSKERAKLGSGWQHAVVWRNRRVGINHDSTGIPTATAIRKAPACPGCGHLITDKEGLPVTVLPNKRLFCEKCATPLYTYAGLRRWPLTDYIKRQLKGFFKCFVADEFHQYKGQSTDQAESYHHLVLACKYTINLTGTLFGGKSTDLFWLRYRVDPGVRQAYGFKDSERWAQHYGRIERTFNKNKEDDNEFGKFSGKERYVTNTKEIPGISPAIFARLLKSCIFIRITDLGYGLPSYHEEISRIWMNDEQEQQYTWMNDILYTKILEGTGWDASPRDRHEAQVMLSVWLQSCLSRPNATFRREAVMWSPNHDGVRVPFHINEHKYMDIDAADLDPELIPDEETGKLPMVLYPIEGLQPKEEELIRVAKAEIAAGRKVILGVRQTGTRNIQPHLQALLQAEGIRAVTLPDTLAPAKREAWIDAQVHNIDVLITNPKKVETGLDLIKFHTIIVYETEYSLYTLWQFMRRVWRLGQQKPVKVIFMVYNDTLESAALSLIGEKMKAALLLYGDNAASAITAESDAGGSLLDELASRILAGEKLSSDGITGLLSQSMADVVEIVEEIVEEEIEEAIQVASVPAGEGVQTASTAIVIATLTPKQITKPQAKSQPRPQYSFFDLEVETTEPGAEPAADQCYQWSDFILSIVSKPAAKELKQAAAGQRSFADLLLGA